MLAVKRGEDETGGSKTFFTESEGERGAGGVPVVMNPEDQKFHNAK